MATKKKTVKKKAPVLDDPKLKLWKTKGASLAKSKNGNQWAIADWMCEGEDGFPKVAYKEAAAVTGMEVDTLRQFAYVARNISTRVDGLSFGHHRAVVGLTPEKQKEMLDHALEFNISVARLAMEIRYFAREGARRAAEAGTSAADLEAKATLETCDRFIRKLDNALLYNEPPTPSVRNDVLGKLRWTISELNRIGKAMTYAWQCWDEEQLAYQRLVAHPDKVMVDAVESGKITKENLEREIAEARAAGMTEEEAEKFRTLANEIFSSIKWRLEHDPGYRQQFEEKRATATAVAAGN